MASQPTPRSHDNILQALILHQANQKAEKVQDELKNVSKERDKHKKDAETHKKKLDSLTTDHKQTKKELHRLKLQFDGNYAFENKQIKKETMAKARAAKKVTKSTVSQKQKEARNAKKTGSTSTSKNSRKTS